MATRRNFLKTIAIASGAVLVGNRPGWASPETTFKLNKFLQPLPTFGPDGIPLASPDTTAIAGADYYRLSMGEYEHLFHPELPKASRLWGYADASVSPTNFGSFQYWFDILGNGTSGNITGPLVFDVAGITVNDFVQNAAGYYFVADILGLPPASTNGALSTGLSAILGPPTQMPEPASLVLLGSGLLGWTLRRRK